MCLIAFENTVNLPDLAAREDGWEVESLILLFEVLLVWNHSTSSGSRLLRLLPVPTEDLHFLIGSCGLWSLELLRRELSFLWPNSVIDKPASDHSVIAIALRQ